MRRLEKRLVSLREELDFERSRLKDITAQAEEAEVRIFAWGPIIL